MRPFRVQNLWNNLLSNYGEVASYKTKASYVESIRTNTSKQKLYNLFVLISPTVYDPDIITITPCNRYLHQQATIIMWSPL